MRVEVDLMTCESNGICMGVVPEVFDLDDDDQLTLLRSQIEPELESAVRDAARQCPRQAIFLAD